jgi:hypothetical protein
MDQSKPAASRTQETPTKGILYAHMKDFHLCKKEEGSQEQKTHSSVQEVLTQMRGKLEEKEMRAVEDAVFLLAAHWHSDEELAKSYKERPGKGTNPWQTAGKKRKRPSTSSKSSSSRGSSPDSETRKSKAAKRTTLSPGKVEAPKEPRSSWAEDNPFELPPSAEVTGSPKEKSRSPLKQTTRQQQTQKEKRTSSAERPKSVDRTRDQPKTPKTWSEKAGDQREKNRRRQEYPPRPTPRPTPPPRTFSGRKGGAPNYRSNPRTTGPDRSHRDKQREFWRKKNEARNEEMPNFDRTRDTRKRRRSRSRSPASENRGRSRSYSKPNDGYGKPAQKSKPEDPKFIHTREEVEGLQKQIALLKAQTKKEKASRARIESFVPKPTTEAEHAEAVEDGQKQARAWLAKKKADEEKESKLEDARKLVRRLFGKFQEGTVRSDTYTPDDAKSKDFTFDELDAALKLLGISFDRKDRVGGPSTVKYTLKTKGLGGMERDWE